MRAVPTVLWIALAGAALQFASLFTDFYVFEGARKTAWFGIAHTSELILLSALITIALVTLTAAGRSPVSGRKTGTFIGIAGSVAALQLAYRMLAPPFGSKPTEQYGIFGNSCLYYCLPSQALPADLLSGIWMALIGCVLVATGGWIQALWSGDKRPPIRTWRSPEQPGMNPWLGLAALGAIGQFVFGYTVFTFYTSQRDTGPVTWSGWLPSPHTSAFVLEMTVLVVALVWSAARARAPLAPKYLGVAIAILGALSAARIGFRIFYSPFRDAVEIGPAAYLSLLSALLIIVAGCVQAGVLSGRDQRS